MSPPTADVDLQPTVVPIPASKASGAIRSSSSSSSQLEGPLAYTGQLDQYEHFDVTSAIGREFPTLQLTDILDDDAKIRDLAVLVSQRGVVFFRRQDIGIDDQKRLGQRLGELTGKPATSRLHRHALSNSKRGIAVDENGRLDDEISIISSEQNRLIYRDRFGRQVYCLSGCYALLKGL